MGIGSVGGVMRHLRKAVFDAAMSDGQLLEHFCVQRDEAAFEALVRRHGPMVLGVCRRILQNGHDAEDAFQATFLVLVRKADTITPPEMVGNWLYGVACRTALKARSAISKQRATQNQVNAMPAAQAPQEDVWQELQPIVDQELSRLPDKYRVPVVLCDLEGKTRKEAAHQLGWPEGTLSWRLASARSMLANRLSRRGVALSAGALTLLLAQKASASVPGALLTSTVQAAMFDAASQAVAAGLISTRVAALTEGVLHTMWWTRMKITLAACLTLALFGTGMGVVSYRTLALAADRQAQAQERKRENPNADNSREREPRKAPAFHGKVTDISADGKTLTVETGGRGEQVKKIEVKLNDQSKVEFLGALKDVVTKLKVGDSVGVSLQEGSKDLAAAIQAQREPNLTGKIAALSADSKTLTIEQPSPNRGEAPVKLDIKFTDKTKTVFGIRGEPEGFKPGNLAMVWLEEGSKDTALGVVVTRPRADVYGSVSAISADGKVVTVESKNRSGETTKTEVKLTDGTKVEFLGAESKDIKLKAGHTVTVWLQEGSQDTAAIIQANVQRRTPDLIGAITAVAADGKSVTIEMRKRGEDTATQTQIKLNDKTEIEFANADKAEEKKLTIGYSASVWLQEGSKDTAAVFRAAKPTDRGR